MSEPTPRPCPRCLGPPPTLLVPLEVDGREIDACPGCRGAWLDADEWTPLVGRCREVEHPRTIPFGATPPLCPVCPERREAFGHGRRRPELVPRAIVGAAGVEVDICQDCGGSWLDGGELAALRERLAASPDSPPDGAGQPAEPTAPRRKVHAAFTRNPDEALSFVEALREIVSRLWS